MHLTSANSLRLCAAVALVLAVALLAIPATATAAKRTMKKPPGMPPKGKVLLGVGGHALEPHQFDAFTKGIHDIHLITIPWRENRTWNEALDRRLQYAEQRGYRIMLHIGTGRVDNGKEGRSPGAVATGKVDAYFLDMGRVINESDQHIYFRPPGEMNGHWSHWSAFNENGSRRDRNHTTAMYKRAFIRMSLIAKGGPVATINRTLKRHKMPPLKTNATELPSSGKITTVWNPQGRGKPDVRGNQPKDYYPGFAFVDYVANDVYAQNGRVAWADNDALYKRYPRHPFMMAEYAPWGYDDPAFMRRMFAWVTSHPRVMALMYFNGTGGTTFQLKRKAKSLAVYRSNARKSRFRCPGFDAFNSTC